MVGHYLGNPANPCITIIDTPVPGDGIALVEDIKQIGSIDAFILLFKSTDTRFSQSIQDQIKLFMNIFGHEMWQNAISAFTFWGHDKQSIRHRTTNRGGLNEDTQHTKWNREYTELFGVAQVIPSVFIDPVYDEEMADAYEKETNKENTDKLWSFISNNLTTFQCDSRCRAPSRSFAGRPWLIPENAVQNKRLGEGTVITWLIWFASQYDSETERYNILKMTSENTTRTLYEYNNTVRSDTDRLLKGMQVLDESNGKFKTVQLTIEMVEEQHYGSYFIENNKGRSDLGQLKKKVDGVWQEWSSFGPCSKTCITSSEQPGVMQRERKCNSPQNRGQPCQGKPTEQKNCAHQEGGDISSFR